MCGFSKMAQQPIHLVVPFHFSEKCFLDMLSPCVVISGGRRVRHIWLPAIFFSGATSKQRFTNNVPKLWKLWRRRYDRKLLSLHLKWFARSWTTTERLHQCINIQGRHLSDVLFKTHWCKTAFCVLSRNKETYAVSSLVLNLLASQTGEFFLPHPVLQPNLNMSALPVHVAKY